MAGAVEPELVDGSAAAEGPEVMDGSALEESAKLRERAVVAMEDGLGTACAMAVTGCVA